MVEFFGVSALLFVASCCAFVYFPNDGAMARFRRNPDPARVETIRKYGRQMVAAGFAFFGCFLVIGEVVGHPYLIYAFAFVLALLLRAMFGASRRPIPPESLPPNGGGRLPYFVAASSDDGPEDLDTSKNPDIYKVFITPTMLCGAQVVNRMRKDGTLIRTFWNGLPWKDAMFYDAFDVTLPGFCLLGPRNFQIAWRDVARVECDPAPRSIRSREISGSVTIRLKSGAERELALLGKRDAKALQQDLQRIVDSFARAENDLLGPPPEPDDEPGGLDSPLTQPSPGV